MRSSALLLAAGLSAAPAAAQQVVAGWATAHDYSLADQNAASATAGSSVGPSYFAGQVTMHYFGHQS